MNALALQTLTSSKTIGPTVMSRTSELLSLEKVPLMPGLPSR